MITKGRNVVNQSYCNQWRRLVLFYEIIKYKKTIGVCVKENTEKRCSKHRHRGRRYQTQDIYFFCKMMYNHTWYVL